MGSLDDTGGYPSIPPESHPTSRPPLVGRRRDGNRPGPREVLDHLLALLRLIHPKFVEFEGALAATVRRDPRVPPIQRLEQRVPGVPAPPCAGPASQSPPRA